MYLFLDQFDFTFASTQFIIHPLVILKRQRWQTVCLQRKMHNWANKDFPLGKIKSQIIWLCHCCFIASIIVVLTHFTHWLFNKEWICTRHCIHRPYFHKASLLRSTNQLMALYCFWLVGQTTVYHRKQATFSSPTTTSTSSPLQWSPRSRASSRLVGLFWLSCTSHSYSIQILAILLASVCSSYHNTRQRVTNQ